MDCCRIERVELGKYALLLIEIMLSRTKNSCYLALCRVHFFFGEFTPVQVCRPILLRAIFSGWFGERAAVSYHIIE
jgi:hypothetical protein